EDIGIQGHAVVTDVGERIVQCHALDLQAHTDVRLEVQGLFVLDICYVLEIVHPGTDVYHTCIAHFDAEARITAPCTGGDQRITLAVEGVLQVRFGDQIHLAADLELPCYT